MGNKNSTEPSNANSKHSTKQVSGSTKDEGAIQRADIKIVQNVLLVWLDINIHNNNQECRKIITKLHRVVNHINTFTDSDECIQFIETITDNKICMIISGAIGQHIVPRVHNMSQVDSFFIFCGNKKFHEQWAKEWCKIKGVFTEITRVCEALKQASQQCEQNAISISFVPTSGDVSSENLDQLDPMFIYAQIMKEIVLTIKFEEQYFKEFIDYCRNIFVKNEDELKNVDKLKQEYRQQTPIWWYTYECFLYPMLNRALRMSDVDIIIKMGFFIADLHQHIEDLHKEQFDDHHADETLTVYRGQGLSMADFNQLVNTKDGLMSFNNFLSTSKDRTASLRFACNALTNPDSVGILFVMTIDPSKSTTPFASINGVNYSEDKEDKVLFSMNTVFRIHDIETMEENNRLFQVHLTLTEDNDKDLRQLTNRIREETFPNAEGWYRLGSVLCQMGEFQKGEEVYEIMLDQTMDEAEKAVIYGQLGKVKMDQREPKEAITFYEKALEIYKKTRPPNDPDLTVWYNQIGIVYYDMGEYSKALSSHEGALEIRQQSLPPNHPDLASSYNNIGLVYNKMGEYSKALSYYEKAVEIDENSLPSNHPNFAISYNNIGSVYGRMGEHAMALPYFEKALEIRQKSLPPTHPSLAGDYDNIGLAYENMGDYWKATSFYQCGVNIAQQSLPPDHPQLKKCTDHLDRIKQKL